MCSVITAINSNILISLVADFRVTDKSYFCLSRIQKYKTLKIKVSSSDDWVNCTLDVYGDSTVIADIRDLSEHTYDISKYSAIKISGHYRGGPGGRIDGQYSLQ